jgi:chemotaxis protein methyltransferase CheR
VELVSASILERGEGALDSPLTLREFRAIAKLVHDRAGIVLGDSKRDLVQGRLGKRLRVLGCRSFTDYLALLEGPEAGEERSIMTNAITTNLTAFFREEHHFEALAKQALPELAKSPSPGRRLRIWSAGCSSGEEPYTVAMTLQHSLPGLAQWDARILATDIDTNMIATARAGVYSEEKAASIPGELRRRFATTTDAGLAEMSPALKQMIRFKPLNLLQPWPMKGPFNVIFCRNVAIYFDKDTQRILFDRFADMLTPDGWLFIGHSESLFRVSERFRHLGRTIYRKVR